MTDLTSDANDANDANDGSGASDPGRAGDEDRGLPIPGAPQSPLDYAAVVLVVAAALLLSAGILYAFAVADARNIGGSERFRLLAQASSPFVAALALTAITLVVHERRRRADAALVAAAAALAVGAVVALVALLLALNGVVVDLTSKNVGSMFRLSNVIGRFATVMMSGFALWLAATAPPARR